MTLPLDLATDKWQQNFRLEKKESDFLMQIIEQEKVFSL